MTKREKKGAERGRKEQKEQFSTFINFNVRKARTGGRGPLNPLQKALLPNSETGGGRAAALRRGFS